MKTVVLGATPDVSRFANRAVKMLKAHGHQVIPVGQKKGEIDGLPIHNDQPQLQDVDTVSLYIGSRNQSDIYDYVVSLKPRRVIFNPGTENREFEDKLKEAGIETVEHCTLVMLGSNTF